MADTTYNVNVRYTVDKQNAESAANSLARTFDRLAATVAGAFAVHRILDFGERLVKLQSEAERFTLTFATMLTGYGAPGFTKGAQDFQNAMAVSKELMMQIRLEASKLPGTAEEMMEIMRAAMPGAIQSGKSIMGQDSAFEMSKRLMAAANLLQIPGGSTTVAREFQAMMEGRAQTRNDLFARIRSLMNDGKGISSKEFNALSESGRWEQVSKALQRLVDPALPTYANTWKAISTTTLNWAQQLARVATDNPYHVLLDSLKSLNDWTQKNQSSIESFAKSIGDKLGGALKSTFGFMKDTFDFIVKNKDTITTVLEAAGALLLGSRIGKAGPIGAAGMGMGINLLTGGSMDAQGYGMALAGAASNLTGALGTAAKAALAFGAAMNLLDQERRDDINRDTETARLTNIMQHSRIGPEGFTVPESDVAILKQIIQENKLNTGYLGSIDNAKLNAYLDQNAAFDNPKLRFDLGDAFDYAARRMRDMVPFGPNEPTAEQKLLQKLYDKPVPRKPDVNVQVNIKQDISQAEDPDRILIRTKQAIEDALIRPIESGNNRFAVLR